MNQKNEPPPDAAAAQDKTASLERSRQHEAQFISRYMSLNGCSESAARAVYMHAFPNWPHKDVS